MQLIIVTGLPGTGKSTLAEAVGQQLGIPVFSKDRIEATLPLFASLSSHLTWLKEAGFRSVDHLWHYWMEHFIIARK